MTETMEHYRCFHCKQVFCPEIAQDHFGKHTTDLPKCIQYARNGSGGGPHDAYIRIRKDEFAKILAALDLAKGLMAGRHSDADLYAIVAAVIAEWQWFPREQYNSLICRPE